MAILLGFLKRGFHFGVCTNSWSARSMDCIQSPGCFSVLFGQRQRQHRGLHNQWVRKGKGASGSNDCLYMGSNLW